MSGLPLYSRAYHRARGRLGTWKNDSLAPWLLERAVEMNRATAAVLEYPFRPSSRWGWDRPANPALAAVLAEGEDGYRRVIDGLAGHLPYLSKIPRTPLPGQPCWVNGYWTALDAVLQYAAIADRRPLTYMEVGSGNSTLFARRAIEDHGLSTMLVSIDPSPRADVDASCDTVHRRPLEELDLAVFDQLQAGDVLLIDGSHTVFMNSDSTVAVLDVLPRLVAGVLVGIHDIFLPWDYPPDWTGRWYGEQYLLAALLLAKDPGWKVTFPAWYVCRESELAGELEDVWDVVGDPPGRSGSSLWLEKI